MAMCGSCQHIKAHSGFQPSQLQGHCRHPGSPQSLPSPEFLQLMYVLSIQHPHRSLTVCTYALQCSLFCLPLFLLSTFCLSVFFHGPVQSAGHAQFTIFSPCSGLFQLSLTIFSLIPTIKLFPSNILWSGNVLILKTFCELTANYRKQMRMICVYHV